MVTIKNITNTRITSPVQNKTTTKEKLTIFSKEVMELNRTLTSPVFKMETTILILSAAKLVDVEAEIEDMDKEYTEDKAI